MNLKRAYPRRVMAPAERGETAGHHHGAAIVGASVSSSHRRRYRAPARRPRTPGSCFAINTAGSSASGRSITPTSRAVASATRRLLCSTPAENGSLKPLRRHTAFPGPGAAE